jgi:two-component system chemotaxis response regulator CheB
MASDDPSRSEDVASGFVCPECGGALWERGGDRPPAALATASELRFECRIGHAYQAAQLWVDHCLTRNRALQYAARSLAENAALARRLADWTREQGNVEAARQLEHEATHEDQLSEQVLRMLGDLPRPRDG